MTGAIENIFFEVYKNFKLIFRNWSSLVLIILAPLFLILLVGYSFSGEQVHGINIGVVATGSINLDEFSQNISSFGQVTRYGTVPECIADMVLQKAHICLEITGELYPEEGQIPTGNVNIYYDNTRKTLSILLLSQIKDFFGLTSEKISLISAEEIFNNLQDLFSFLQERIADVENVKNQSIEVQQDLIQRRNKLIEIRDFFEPRYLRIKEIQAELHNYSDSFENSADELASAFGELHNATETLKNFNFSYGNGSASVGSTAMLAAISKLDSTINSTVDAVSGTGETAENLTEQVDAAVLQLDELNVSLNGEIAATEEYILLINESVEDIDLTVSQANEKLASLSQLDPSLSSKLVKPITQEISALIPDLKDIQLAFPVLLLTVAIFISVIFSNILTSIEINNRAYTRNILAPVNDIIFVVGMALTNFFIVLFQIAVLLVVAQTRFHVDVVSALPALLPVIAAIVFTFVFIGMIMSYISKNPQTSILLSTFVALAFFLFSDALNALEAMPVFAAKIAAFNPVVIAGGMLRQIVFFGIPLSQMANSLVILLCYLAIALLLLLFFSKIRNSQRF